MILPHLTVYHQHPFPEHPEKHCPSNFEGMEKPQAPLLTLYMLHETKSMVLSFLHSSAEPSWGHKNFQQMMHLQMRILIMEIRSREKLQMYNIPVLHPEQKVQFQNAKPPEDTLCEYKWKCFEGLAFWINQLYWTLQNGWGFRSKTINMINCKLYLMT